MTSSRFGWTFILSTSFALLTAGCGRQGEPEAEQKPLSKQEAAKYRQVTIHVTGMT